LQKEHFKFGVEQM